MLSFSGERFSRAGVGEDHVRSRGPRARSVAGRGALQFVALAALAATLAACAQPNVVAERSGSLAGSRHASTRSDGAATSARKASTRQAAVAAKGAAPAAAGTQDASYGLASYYSYDPHTASGEKFNSRELTAAHRTLPFGTRVRVTNVSTGQAVTVRVNDRGPFVPGRVVDVSRGAAESLGLVGRGVAKVKVEVVD